MTIATLLPQMFRLLSTLFTVPGWCALVSACACLALLVGACEVIRSCIT